MQARSGVYDVNILLYASKAMDLFDLATRNTADRDAIRAKGMENRPLLSLRMLDLPRKGRMHASSPSHPNTTPSSSATTQGANSAGPPEDLARALANHPTVILVSQAKLFRAW